MFLGRGVRALTSETRSLAIVTTRRTRVRRLHEVGRRLLQHAVDDDERARRRRAADRRDAGHVGRALHPARPPSTPKCDGQRWDPRLGRFSQRPKKNFESCPRACGPLRPGVEREGCSADSTCRAPPASFFENDGRRWGGTGYVRRSPCRPEGGNNFRSSSGVGDEARDSTSKED